MRHLIGYAAPVARLIKGAAVSVRRGDRPTVPVGKGHLTSQQPRATSRNLAATSRNLASTSRNLAQPRATSRNLARGVRLATYHLPGSFENVAQTIGFRN